MRYHGPKTVLTAGIVLASSSLVPLAQAQDVTGTAASQNPADIIVTARRVEERLQDVPISITVFNQEQLTKRNIVNAEDLAAYTPSLSATTNFGTDNASFAVRGFVQDPGTPPSVGIYFADVVAPRGTASSGIPSGDGAGPGSFFDLQNVQVLKGPQGTLFGRNTTGGAILLVPNKPSDKLEGYIEGSYGNYDMRRVQGAINLPLGASARLRIAGDHMDRDGYQRNDTGVGPSRFGDVGYTALRASLIVDLTPTLQNYTIVSFLHSGNNSSVQKLIACDPNGLFGPLPCNQLSAARARGAGFYTVQNGLANPYSRLNQWQVINTTTLLASDKLTIKNIASYAENRNGIATDYGGTFWPVGPGQNVIFSVIQSPPNKDISSQYTITDELQVQGSAGRLKYQAGGYFEYSGPMGSSGIASPVLLACAGGSSDGFQCSDPLGIGATLQFGFPINVGSVSYSLARTTFRNVGVYAQGSYDLTDQLTLTAGIRYTWDRQSVVNQRQAYFFPVTPPYTQPPTITCFDASSTPNGCVYQQTQRSRKPTWLIDLDYKPMTDLLLYAKYARGYRAGGVFPNSPTNYRVFQPEKVDAYEAGAKWSFRGALSGYVNVAGFYNNFSNQQIFVGFTAAPGSGAPPTTGVVNAGKSRIYGAEVEAGLTPFTGFNLSVSYSYLNATIRKIAPLVSIDPNYLISAPILPGDPLLLSPKHKLSLTGAYTLPLAPDIGRVSFGATYTYTARQLSAYDFNNPALLPIYGRNLENLQARNILNLNVDWNGIAGSPVDLALFATNVTRQKYYTYVPSFGNLGFLTATLGLPRMYGVRLRYTFGR